MEVKKDKVEKEGEGRGGGEVKNTKKKINKKQK